MKKKEEFSLIDKSFIILSLNYDNIISNTQRKYLKNRLFVFNLY